MDRDAPAGSWPIVALLSLTATASYLCRVNISVTGALVMREYNLTQVEMGRLFSIFVLGYALAQIPAGALADRWGARRILMASAWAWVAGTAVQTLVGVGSIGRTAGGALLLLLAFRFLLGVSEAPTFPAAAQGISRWIPPAAQGRANGLVLAAIGLGSAIAPPFLSFVMVRWGWRAALLASSAPALLVALVWLAIEEPASAVRFEPGTRSNSFGDNEPRLIFSRSFALLTASYTLQGYVGYIFVFWFYLYLVQERHFDLLRSGALASLPWLLSIASIPLGGFISDRLAAGRVGRLWGRRLVPMVGLGGSGILTAVGARADNAYVAAVALALATACVLSVEGPFWATMMEIVRSDTGVAGGTMNMGSNIGGLVSPALTPVLAAYTGWQTALFVAAGLAIVAAGLWLGVSFSPPAAAVEAGTALDP